VLDDEGQVLVAPWIGDRQDARPQAERRPVRGATPQREAVSVGDAKRCRSQRRLTGRGRTVTDRDRLTALPPRGNRPYWSLGHEMIWA
jgi:hypothetical protein